MVEARRGRLGALRESEAQQQSQKRAGGRVGNTTVWEHLRAIQGFMFEEWWDTFEGVTMARFHVSSIGVAMAE